MRAKNPAVLSLIAEVVEKQINNYSFRTIANVINYYANLEFTDPNLFQKLEKELIKRLKIALEINSNFLTL